VGFFLKEFSAVLKIRYLFIKTLRYLCPVVVIAIGLASIIASATPYQRMGFSGGYKDQCLDEDIYLITVRVNAYTDEATAYEYFHRRASEIVKENGYKRYEVLEFGTSKKHGLVYFSGKPYIVQKPSVYGRIKCHRD
jgi:hypothetical protein